LPVVFLYSTSEAISEYSKVAAPPLDSLRRAGNLSRGHEDTRKILKRKKRTDKARFDGQRFEKLKVVTWNVRGIAEKTGITNRTTEFETFKNSL
jgi:hypothetical protein